MNKETQDHVLILPQFQSETKNLSVESQAFLKQANAVTVNSTEESVVASGRLGVLKAALKKIEDKRLSFTKPLNDSLREINSTFTALKEPLKRALGVVDGKIHAFRESERKRIEIETAKVLAKEAKAQKLRDAHEAKGHTVTENPVLAKPLELSQVDPTPVRKDWVWETEDARLVTREYLEVNTTAVNNAVRAGERTIPGIRIFQKETLVNRRTERAF